MPAFGPTALRDLVAKMTDVADDPVALPATQFRQQR